MASSSNYLELKGLDHSLGVSAYSPVATVYVALFTAFTEGGTQTEVVDGTYARQSVAFDAAGSRATANSALISFPAATTGWVNTHFAIMDAVSGGNVLYWGVMSITVGAAEILEIAAGDIDISHGQAGDGISDYAADKWLDLVLRNQAWSMPTAYLAFFTAYTNDSTYTEVSDGNYARQAIAFDAAAAGATQNTSLEEIPAAATGYTATHVAIFDAVSAGNMLSRATLDSSVVVGADEKLRIPVGDLDATWD